MNIKNKIKLRLGILFIAVGAIFSTSGAEMLTGNYNSAYRALKDVIKCSGNSKVAGRYYYLPGAIPLERKDIVLKSKTPIDFKQGVLTDGDPDFKLSGVIFNNDRFGAKKPDPNYVEFRFDEPQEITAVIAVPAIHHKDFYLMKGAVRFLKENGKWEQWRMFDRINTKLSHGNRISPLIYKTQTPYKTRGVQLYLNGFRKVGLSEVYILGNTTKMTPKEVRLVLPDHPDEIETFAAKLLMKYIKKITGQSVDIVSESTAGHFDNNIFIGRCKNNDPYMIAVSKHPEALFIRSSKKGVHLTGGGPRGVLYSALEFLYIQGVRFVTSAPYGTVVPHLKSLKIRNLDVKAKPRFEQRFLGGNLGGDRKRCSMWGLMNRLNGPYENSVLKGMGRTNQFWAHSYHRIVPASLFDKYPEMFALGIDGQRNKNGLFCTTYPQTIKRGVQLVKHSKANYITISPDDGRHVADYCHCLNCRQLDTNEVSRTDRAIQYANELADSLTNNRRIMVLAYSAHRFPPSKVKPDDRLIIQYCIGDGKMNIARGLDDQKNTDTCDDLLYLKKWAKLAKHLEVYMYYQNGAHTVGPFPVLSGLSRMLNDLETIGVEGFYSQSQSVKGHYSIFYYILSRLLWQRGDWRTILKDVAPRYYGAGGIEMIRYFTNWETFISKEKIPVSGVLWKFPQSLNNKKFLSKQWKCLERAWQLAANEEQRLRIDQVRLEFLSMEIYLAGGKNTSTDVFYDGNEYVVNSGRATVPPNKLLLWRSLAKRLGISVLANYDGRKLSLKTAEVVWKSSGSHRYKTVRLKNRFLSVVIVPKLGGRIISVTKADGVNLLCLPTKLDANCIFGGYEECAGNTISAGGREEAYSVRKINSQSIELHCLLEKQKLEMIRRITLDSKRPIIHIESRLINLDNKPRQLSFRSRLMLPEETCRLMTDQGKGLQELPSNGKRERWLTNSQLPKGVWSLGKLGQNIVNHFSSDQIEKCYVYWGGNNAANSFNGVTMELFSKRKKIAPKQALIVKQSYEFLNEKKH